MVIALAAGLKVATLALLVPPLLFKSPKLGKKRLALLFGFCFVFIWATYGFRAQALGNFSDIKFPFGGYLRSLKENLLFAKRGQPIFFNEVLYQKSPWFKTPLVIATKSSLPLLILAGWGLIKGKRRNHLVLIILLGLIFGLLKPLNFGMRHLLPIQLALVLLAAKVRPKSMLNWMVFILLIIWQIASFWTVMPQPLTFVNELVRHPARIFSDSDFDWGQGLVELRSETNRLGLTGFQLAYFGNNNPADHLSDFRLVTDIGEINYRQPAIISVTCYYQCGYYRDPYFSRVPKRMIAKSFFLFP